MPVCRLTLDACPRSVPSAELRLSLFHFQAQTGLPCACLSGGGQRAVLKPGPRKLSATCPHTHPPATSDPSPPPGISCMVYRARNRDLRRVNKTQHTHARTRARTHTHKHTRQCLGDEERHPLWEVLAGPLLPGPHGLPVSGRKGHLVGRCLLSPSGRRSGCCGLA